MPTTRRRAAALLLTGALLPSLPGCAPPAAPAVAQTPGPAAAPAPVVRAKADAPRTEEPAREDGGGGFRFPDDKGGRMLAQVLPPHHAAGADESVGAGPRRRPASPALEQPSLPLPPNQGQVPRLPAGRQGPPLRPRPLPDGLPLTGPRPQPPQEPRLPAGDRVRLPGPDVNQPTPLPVLAAPAPDRSAAEDPTADFSSGAAQSAAVPARRGPAPFAKVSLPDPFENRNAVRLRQPPPERDDPVTAAPKPPGK